MVTILNSRPLLWVLLAIPAGLMLYVAAGPHADLEELLHPSGEFSARLMIIALMLTPLGMIFPAAPAIRWLQARRRAFGVAAFGYAVLHTLFYLLAMGNLDDILVEIGALGIWTGWAAFALFIPLAVTSNDAAMRALGRGWKRVQRLAYLAAVLTLIHWIFIHNNLGPALVHFAPLIVLETWRLIDKRRIPATAAQ